MTAAIHANDPIDAPAAADGFDALDFCHRQINFTLGKLAALVARLKRVGPDGEARVLAREISHFFSTTARQHHEDEERHVFLPLLDSASDEVRQAVLRLQQDHGWLEQDWLELAPQLDAVAAGTAWYNLDELSEGVDVFIALSRDHIVLEESLVYPEARARLSDDDKYGMGREMAARRRAA